jgi:hypothetical protein
MPCRRATFCQPRCPPRWVPWLLQSAHQRRASLPGGRQVEDAASLWGKKEALQEERQRLQQRLVEEEEAAAGRGGGPAPSTGGAAGADTAQEDALDAFMSGGALLQCGGCLSVCRRPCRHLPTCPAQHWVGPSGCLAAFAGIERRLMSSLCLPFLLLRCRRGGAAGERQGGGGAAGAG